MSYYLKSSQADRINFDSFAFNCGVDAFKAYTDGDPDDADDMAADAWTGALSVEDFQDTDPEEHGYVEDLEEAEARWMDQWVKGYRAAHEWRQQDVAADAALETDDATA